MSDEVKRRKIGDLIVPKIGDLKTPKVGDAIAELTRIIPREPSVDWSAFRSNPHEMQAKWNATEMRNMHRQQGENLVKVITERVKMLEAALKDGEELAVYCDAGPEQLRVQSFDFPTWNLAVIVGLDANGNQTHRIENVQDVKLTCKTLAIPVNAERRPIGFSLPPKE